MNPYIDAIVALTKALESANEENKSLKDNLGIRLNEVIRVDDEALKSEKEIHALKGHLEAERQDNVSLRDELDEKNDSLGLISKTLLEAQREIITLSDETVMLRKVLDEKEGELTRLREEIRTMADAIRKHKVTVW